MDSLSHHLSPPFTGCSPVASQAVQSSTTFSDSCDMCIVACWLITATSSRSSRSRFVDSPPSWRTSLVASAYLNRTFSPRPLNLLCHAVLLMSGDLLMVSGSVPVRIRSPSWLSTGGLRRSRPRAASEGALFRGHSSASRPPARQVAAASLSPLSSLCGLPLLVRGQHINSN